MKVLGTDKRGEGDR